MSQSTEITGDIELSSQGLNDSFAWLEDDIKLCPPIIHSMSEFKSLRKEVLRVLTLSVKNELMRKTGSLCKLTALYFEKQLPSALQMTSLFNFILKTYPYNKYYDIKTQKDDMFAIIRCRILSSEIVLTALADLLELNVFEAKPFLKLAVRLIFDELICCENNVKIGISYLLFCKSRFEFLRDLEIRLLDPFHDEQLALEMSIFEFWQSLTRENKERQADAVLRLHSSEPLFVGD